MTIFDNVGVVGPFNTHTDMAGFEGTAASIAGGYGDELVSHADEDTDAQATTVCGVICSVLGDFVASGDGSQMVTVQIQGVAYGLASAATALGALLVPANTTYRWQAAGAGDMPKAMCMQAASAAGDLIKIALIGTAAAAIA
jgi:hypothetical protein